VAFADWPKISVDQIKEPSPLLFPSDLPGSVQPKKLPSVDQARFCNFRTTGGYYVLQRCD